MNIHEHQAKEIFKEFGISVPNGVPIYNLDEIEKKFKLLKTNKIVLKAQIHAGGRGKAGGIKVVNNINELKIQAKNLFGKKLFTPQTGSLGREVKRLYIEETINIKKEFYLSCLIDRSSSKIAFISSAEGGMDIEDVAKKNPKKIITTKVSLSNSISEDNIKKILQPYSLSIKSEKKAQHLIQSIYNVLIEKDANLIEINPLILTSDEDLLCLDAKINFDDNALYRHPDIMSLRDINEEDPTETEASKHNLTYIKLDGKIGCMVNGAGLAMATMDIIKFYGAEPANFLDVGGGASKEKVSAAFKIILSDKNVKGILINIFGGIMRCDVLAEGVVEVTKKTNLSVPLVVRLAGTNVELGKQILQKSNLKIIPADNLSDAAKKIIEVTK
ncbi:MAG TPA: ADP-forming succinate--CoA ligase subunit beta [Candidatus Pelagibacter sp.]|jgi:succinyl-CoA synthetase beta subunit|nr:ADP-forming succinate--CoA ligase subunit beta [Candidatus Pelagibacter sp.]